MYRREKVRLPDVDVMFRRGTEQLVGSRLTVLFLAIGYCHFFVGSFHFQLQDVM